MTKAWLPSMLMVTVPLPLILNFGADVVFPVLVTVADDPLIVCDSAGFCTWNVISAVLNLTALSNPKAAIVSNFYTRSGSFEKMIVPDELKNDSIASRSYV